MRIMISVGQEFGRGSVGWFSSGSLLRLNLRCQWAFSHLKAPSPRRGSLTRLTVSARLVPFPMDVCQGCTDCLPDTAAGFP